ncbi:MarR family winged helix-turn-helix transcriptional regulator [Bordetella sp. BOR01]|uniref:MarR family winged helix-turn-helix transcriptional regulator n=1 Tax=Bordetella sp. BOR01 TaxID=2854779 RepID=UPI001C44993D|nr:MarR family transcriptional regulator [Bordetella sp. BOR01]MBV7482642.1 MarR family transcriptional regulator [Bordetella sp. BOR01]
MSPETPDLWFSFVRAHRLVIREVERRLAEAGLPAYAWYDALWGLESGPAGTRRMHELADVLAVERYNLTRLIDRLEQDGLVTRARSPQDGRAAYATITREGRTLRKKMWKVYQAAVADLFLARFDAGEKIRFATALDKAAQAARQSGQAA